MFCWILQCEGALVQGGGRVADRASPHQRTDAALPFPTWDGVGGKGLFLLSSHA